MIPKEVFWSIAAVMGVSCAFGWMLRGIIDKARRGHTEASGGHVERTCANCRYSERPWFLEPCDSCTGNASGWEEKR